MVQIEKEQTEKRSKIVKGKLTKNEMIMIEKFLEPELKIIRFETMDVITASDILDEDELPPVVTG